MENVKDPGERYVTLMFDEMSIRRHLSYNRKLDRIDGYQDHKGQGVSGKVIDFLFIKLLVDVLKYDH